MVSKGGKRSLKRKTKKPKLLAIKDRCTPGASSSNQPPVLKKQSRKRTTTKKSKSRNSKANNSNPKPQQQQARNQSKRNDWAVSLSDFSADTSDCESAAFADSSEIDLKQEQLSSSEDSQTSQSSEEENESKTRPLDFDHQRAEFQQRVKNEEDLRKDCMGKPLGGHASDSEGGVSTRDIHGTERQHLAYIEYQNEKIQDRWYRQTMTIIDDGLSPGQTSLPLSPRKGY